MYTLVLPPLKAQNRSPRLFGLALTKTPRLIDLAAEAISLTGTPPLGCTPERSSVPFAYVAVSFQVLGSPVPILVLAAKNGQARLFAKFFIRSVG